MPGLQRALDHIESFRELLLELSETACTITGNFEVRQGKAG
jgi:hypothetical protein